MFSETIFAAVAPEGILFLLHSTPPDITPLVFFSISILALAGVYLLFEWLVRIQRCSSEITRRILHISACLFFAFNSCWLNTAELLFLLLCFLVAVTISKRHLLFRAVHQVKRKTAGELLLPIGLIAAAILSVKDPSIFLFSCLVIGLADPAAGIVGTIKKSPTKTILGSLAFLVVTIVILLFSSLTWWSIPVFAVIATMIERYSLFGTDNLFIPLFIALILLI